AQTADCGVTLPEGVGLEVVEHVRILIDGEYVRAQLEQRARVPARPERAVDVPRSRLNGQMVEHFGRHDADVGSRVHVVHPTNSRNSSGAGGLSCTASRFASHRPSFQISSLFGAPTTMTLPSSRANVRSVEGSPIRPVESSLAFAAPE